MGKPSGKNNWDWYQYGGDEKQGDTYQPAAALPNSLFVRNIALETRFLAPIFFFFAFVYIKTRDVHNVVLQHFHGLNSTKPELLIIPTVLD